MKPCKRSSETGSPHYSEMTPTNLKGSEFESLLIKAAARTEGVTMGRYPVGSVIIAGSTRPMQVPSHPDFEGVFAGGRQFIIEAKVESSSSFPLKKSKLKPRQVSHMLERSRFGVPCWLVIHFNERRLKTISEPAETIAIPVSDDHPMWRQYVEAHAVARRSKAIVEPQGSISRERASRLGANVRWTIPKGCRTALPDLGQLLGITNQEPQLI
jgi:hypothetical protein